MPASLKMMETGLQITQSMAICFSVSAANAVQGASTASDKVSGSASREFEHRRLGLGTRDRKLSGPARLNASKTSKITYFSISYMNLSTRRLACERNPLKNSPAFPLQKQKG
jgi:hypothetical protein